MFRESNAYGSAAGMRHTDGSINFDAYREIARRARTAAIIASIEGAVRAANAMLSSVGATLAGKSAKHPPHHAK